MAGVIEGIYLAREGGAPAERVEEAEDLDLIGLETGLRVENGEHRRNIVTRGVNLKDLRRARFRIGEVLFGHGKPCSVCRHVERLTEPGMTQALRGRAGMCAKVLESGRVRSGDTIVVS